MRRAICFDVTHMVARLGIGAPTGIDNVDLRFARHYAEARMGPAVHYGKSRPHVLAEHRIAEIVALANDTPWRADHTLGKARLADVRASLLMTPTVMHSVPHVPFRSRPPNRTPNPLDQLKGWWELRNLRRWRRHLRRLKDLPEVPRNAIYLNVAQHRLEDECFFHWLKERPDVSAVMFIHDLLPLDVPELFGAGEPELFARRIDTAIEYAGAFICSTHAVRERLAEECRRRGRRSMPIHVEPLASMLEDDGDESNCATDPSLAATSYFVVLGTIEARKNHLLLLHIWRSLMARGAPPPKLLIIGARGWGNDQVLDVLERGKATQQHVIETSSLPAPAVRKLLVSARALLMPSFDEGYGLPLVEALSLGVPVVATDGPVFREVTQGCATFIDPLDGPGWRAAILDLADTNSERSRAARALALRFQPPRWSSYFAHIEEYVSQL